MTVLYESELQSLPLFGRGKVRDMYEIDDQHLLIVATDRLSAFDVVLPTPIPDKGRILTAMANFWFVRLADIVPHHLTTRTPEEFLTADEVAQVHGRAVVVQRLEPLPLEAIVRGYLSGSGWLEYQRSGTVCGIPLAAGLQESARLPEPLFTPSTKAAQGEHDVNIDFETLVSVLGARQDLAERIRSISLELYQDAASYALERGIIIADTKFEFGLIDDQLVVIDEIFTPDSSRFWPRESYEPGHGQPSFDKQHVRDYLTSTGWDKRPPAPALPAAVVERTTQKYRQALRQLTGTD
ncbi:Phosphoribosylaminoimidazole-succinocarboxamide synthase [Candidatus Entotheonellaceae bacterium PAL068K]